MMLAKRTGHFFLTTAFMPLFLSHLRHLQTVLGYANVFLMLYSDLVTWTAFSASLKLIRSMVLQASGEENIAGQPLDDF